MKHWTGRIVLTLTTDAYAENEKAAKRLIADYLSRVLIPANILARGYDATLQVDAGLVIKEEEQR